MLGVNYYYDNEMIRMHLPLTYARGLFLFLCFVLFSYSSSFFRNRVFHKGQKSEAEFYRKKNQKGGGMGCFAFAAIFPFLCYEIKLSFIGDC